MARGRAGTHAIVIGGGIAGLFAARILADHFARVTVLERDRFPDGPTQRKKTPQAPHSHVFGAHGYALLSELFPGLDDDLRVADAPVFDFIGDHRHYAEGWAPRFPSGLTIRLCTRMLLEWRMRVRLLERDNVQIRSGCRVVDLLVDSGKTRVTGVRTGNEEELRAELVVDTSGFASRTPRWLTAMGYEAPRANMVDMRGAIITQVFRMPPSFAPDWRMLSIRPTLANRRSVALMRIENGLWRTSMLGWGGCYPPKDAQGLLEFARAAPHPSLYEAIKDAEPVSPVYYYGNSMSRWVRYDELQRFPDGLVVFGDAVFHGNPEHAQGMTFCVQAALVLDDLLARSRGPVAQQRGFSLRFQRSLAPVYGPPWSWNTGAELVVPDITADPPSRTEAMLHGCYRQIRKRAFDDGAILQAAMQIHQGQHHPVRLFHPSILMRAARHAMRARKNTAGAAAPSS